MTSALCTVNTLSTENGIDLSDGANAHIALADTAGVSSWTLTCVGTDENYVASAITSSLTTDYVTKQSDLTMPTTGGHGAALIMESVVNNGRDVNGIVNPAYKARFALFVKTATGLRISAANETTEGNAAVGWTKKLNELTRSVDTVAAAGATNAQPVRLAATGNVTLSGTPPIDGITPSLGDRVLAPDQTVGKDSGIYVVAVGAWARASDADTSVEMYAGRQVQVVEGNTNAGKTFVLIHALSFTLNTDACKFLPLEPEIDARVYAKANGTTDDLANLQTAHTASATVRYTPGTYAINSNGTIGGANKTLKFVRGAQINVASGKTLTINGFIASAPDQQIFTGPGTVVLANITNEVVYPGWYGVVGDGVTDDSVKLEQIFDNVPAACTVYYPPGTYKVGSAAATTIAVASNGASLPQATINVASVSGFNGSGHLYVTTSAGKQLVTYTGVVGSSFTGCSGGTGMMSTGGAVAQTFVFGTGTQVHRPAPGAHLQLTGTVTMTPSIDALPGQSIFTGAGSIVFSPVNAEGIFATWVGANGDGVTDNVAAFARAYSAADSVRHAQGTYSVITTSIGTVNSIHTFERDAKIYVQSGHVLTLSGFIDAPPDQQIFDGPGVVTFANCTNPSIPVGWFGARGNADSYDDAPAINKAIVIGVQAGIDVSFHRPPNVHFSVRSMIGIGSFGTASQGIRLLFPGSPYNVANLKCTASLGAGVPMVRIVSTFRCTIANACFDANGLADFCIQRVAPVFGSRASGIPGWQNRFEQLSLRNARVANVLNGDIHFRATVSGDTFTAAGHELANDDRVYLIPVLRSSAIPGNFSKDTMYYVVSASGNTFKLSLTSGGAAVTASNSGTTGTSGWIVARKDVGDVTAGLSLGTVYGNIFPGVAAYPVAHVINAADNTFEVSEIGSSFQGSMQTPIAGGRDQFTANAAANTITSNVVVFDSGNLRAPVVGDVLMLWADNPFGGGALPAPLSPDTEYWVTSVVDNGGGSHTMTLSLTQGGTTVDITGAGTGTWTCSALAPPFYGVLHELGSFNIRNGVTVAHYADVAIKPRPGATTGYAGTVQIHSESWRMLDGDGGGITLSNQIGYVTLDACSHSSIWQNSGQASIIWNGTLFGGLHVDGGAYTGDLKTISDVNNQAPIKLTGPTFWAPNRQPDVVDPAGVVRGHWLSNGVPRQRLLGSQVNIAIQPTSTAVSSDEFRFDLTGGNARLSTLSKPFIVECPSASAWELHAPGAGFGLILADNIQLGDGAGSVHTTITFPGNIPTLANPTSWVHSVTGHWASIASVYCQFQAPDVFLDATTLNLRDGGGAAQGTFTYGSNNVTLAASNGLFMNCGSGASIQLKYNGTGRFKGDANGISFFGGGTAAQPTITGALSSVTDANAKNVLTSIISALSGCSFAINGTT